MIDINKIYPTNKAGDLRIIKYVNSLNVFVEFLLTGFTTKANSSDITKGEVKDRMHPSICGVGYIGKGTYKSSENKKNTKQYKAWKNMIERCYNETIRESVPTYIDCTVCEEWHNFQNFARWMDENYIEGCELDKDIKVTGNKVYSPDSCIFVSRRDNNIKAHAKSYIFISPLEGVVNIYNLTKFCRDNNLTLTSMQAVHKGRSSQHKGWRANNDNKTNIPAVSEE